MAANVAYGMGLINLAHKSHLDELEKSCQGQMDKGKINAGVCFELLDKIVSGGVAENKGFTKYNVSQ